MWKTIGLNYVESCEYCAAIAIVVAIAFRTLRVLCALLASGIFNSGGICIRLLMKDTGRRFPET